MWVMGVQMPPNSASAVERVMLLANEAEEAFREVTKFIARSKGTVVTCEDQGL